MNTYQFIIQGMSSLTALLALTYSFYSVRVNKESLRKQLNVQLATTIHKEWINNVRESIAKLIELFLVCKSAKDKYLGANFYATDEY